MLVAMMMVYGVLLTGFYLSACDKKERLTAKINHMILESAVMVL